MNKTKLIEWIDNPSLINEDATKELRDIVHEFPASPVLHWLYLKGLQNQKSYLFNSALSRAAIGSPNRAYLLKWVGLEPETQEAKKQRFEFVIPEVQKEESVKETKVEAIQETPANAVEQLDQEKTASISEIEEKVEPVLEEKTEKAKPDTLKPVVAKKKSADLPDDIKAILERSKKIRTGYSKPVEEEQIEEVEVNTSVETEEKVMPTSTNQEAVEQELESKEVQPVITDSEDLVKESEIQNTSTADDADETYFSLDFGPSTVETDTIEKDEEDVFETPFEIILDDFSEEEDETQELSIETEVEEEEIDEFSSWLKNLNTQKETAPKAELTIDLEVQAEPKEPKPISEKKASKIALIDKFLAEKPKIVPKKDQFSIVDISSTNEDDEGQYITETLAQIYVKQGHYNKAIEAYEILGLKYPEKNSLFADRIREIKRIK